MKTQLFGFLLTASFVFSVACGGQQTVNNKAVPPPNTATPVPTSTKPKDGDYPGRGKVTKINLELGSVELNHEEIVGVMPPMIMEFYVSDKSLLSGVAVGDAVEFTLRYKHPSETIVSITKIK